MSSKKALSVVLAVASVAALAAPAEAATLDTYGREIRQWFASGGNTMWFILACSVMALAFTVERLLRMRRSQIVPPGLADRARQLWAQGKFDELNALCDADNSTLSRAIKIMVRHRDVGISDIRPIVGDAMSAELGLFHRRIHPLAVAATVAPLLGLFGTVSGMITAFRQFRALGETGDPGVFAGAISVALVTTQAGLVVAIPSLAAWHYFRNRTNTYINEMEGILQELIVEWFLRRGNPAPTTGGLPAPTVPVVPAAPAAAVV